MWSYGGTEDYWRNMEAEKARMYWEAITVIEAQAMLTAMTISQFPNMKRAAQNELHRKIQKMAYPKTFDKVEVVTPEEAMARVNG